MEVAEIKEKRAMESHRISMGREEKKAYGGCKRAPGILKYA